MGLPERGVSDGCPRLEERPGEESVGSRCVREAIERPAAGSLIEAGRRFAQQVRSRLENQLDQPRPCREEDAGGVARL